MRPRRSNRPLVVALVAILLAPALSTSAVAGTRTQKLSNETCDAFADYFTIEFLVAFASAFAGLGEQLGADSKDGDDTSISAEEIQDVFHLVFSPKLETVTGTLAEGAPGSIRKVFARQQAVFADGIDLLREVGLTRKQLAALAELDLAPDTDVTQVLGDIDLPKAKLDAAAKRFGARAGDLDLTAELGVAQQRAFRQMGSRCGVFPESSLDCEELVGTDLSAPLVGGVPKVANDQGSCTFTGPEEVDGDEPVMIVDVYQTPRTFDRLVGQLPSPEEVDADTYVADGFSSFSSAKTCGRTLYTRTDDESIVIAVCPRDDQEVAAADLLAVRDDVVAARSVLGRKSG